MRQLNDIQIDMLEYLLNMPRQKQQAGLIYLYFLAMGRRLNRLDESERKEGEKVANRLLEKYRVFKQPFEHR